MSGPTQPPAAWWAELDALRADLDQLRREVIQVSTMDDEAAEVTELRVIALEELAASRWPRSVGVRHRLRRELRLSVEHIDGETFRDKRVNAIGSGWGAR